MITPATFTSVINSYLPEPHASLLNGILFGINLKTSKEFYQQLKVVGLLHIVVLSGMNISIMAAVVGTALASLGKKFSSALTILTIIIFIAFVGAQAPIIRAGIMGILTIVAVIYGKRNVALFALVLSGLTIAVVWPAWIKTLSFQLSFGATLGIILWGKAISKKKKNIVERVKSNIRQELRTSVAAQAFTVPLIFLYFKQVSLIAPISNVLVAPILPPLMVFGFLTAFLGKIHPILGFVPSYISYALLTYIICVVETLAKLPFVFFSFN